MSYYFYQAADGSYCNLARATRIYFKLQQDDVEDDPSDDYVLTSSPKSGNGLFALIDNVEYMLTEGQDTETLQIQLRSLMSDLARAQSK